MWHDVRSAALDRPLRQRLGVRLALALAIALLPLGVVSGLQSRSVLKEARARSEAALLGETLLAAAPEAGLIRGARTAASALAAAMTGLPEDPAACSAVMRRVLDESDGVYSFVAFVPLSGIAQCTSNGKPLDLTQSERRIRMKENPQRDVVVIRQAAASLTSVLAFGHPVFDEAGRYLGYVSISLPHTVLDAEELPESDLRRLNRLQPIALITFDAAGEVLTSSTGLDDAPNRLPGDRPLTDVATDRARTFIASAVNGVERVYAVFPLVDGQIYAIGSWPIAMAGGPLSLWVSPYVMPALMWLASLLVAMLAAERLVTRHIRALRRSITSFAAGNHRVEGLAMHDAAIEIRDVADAYLTMTDTIVRDAADLENMVHQREVLLREVHHRVKNNLQLIASIMNIQMRQSHSHEAKTLMKSLQDRVMSLATIHRGLYQTSGLADVRADELLSDILHQILKMATGPGRRFEVVTHFDDLRLTPDQAVPLSLLLTEALTNAVKYAGTEAPGVPRLEVSLRREGRNEAVLTVANSKAPGPAPASHANGPGGTGPGAGSSTGLGSQLLMAFGQQLGAHSTISTTDGLYSLRVQFAVRALTEAEAGVAPATPDPVDDTGQVDGAPVH